MSKLDFFSYFRSSSAFRVRIALQLKKVPHNYHSVHLLNNGGEQRAEAYRQINPMGEVPAIHDNGFNLGQSMAILFYLDDCFPEPRLFPVEPKAKARVIELCEFINSGIQPLHNLIVQQELEKRYGVDSAGKEDWVHHWIQRGLATVERSLLKSAGTFSVGGQVSAVDCYLVPQYRAAQRFNTDLSAFPNVCRIAENCLKLEAFQKAEARNQPDTPTGFTGV